MSSIATDQQLSSLREAISDQPPYCSGTCVIPAENFNLYFTKGDEAHMVDFSDANAEQIQALSDACSPATFGRNNKDVLDESYRKAAKLDTKFFATNLNPEKLGLLDVVRSQLLSGTDGQRSIHFELYKLNVYGKGSFFKAHKDTPRAENMFGSLVIVYPTKHEGGALVLRHKGQEWTFDSATEVASASELSIGYVAFFSDVEHEVLEVTSGSRVTLTYNLYFTNDKISPSTSSALSGASSAHALASTFETAFAELLKSPDFLPEGGYLGFGLNHQYPFQPSSGFPKNAVAYLKGPDAMILSVAQTLGLQAALKLAYIVGYDDQYQILTERFIGRMDYAVEDLLLDIKRAGDIIIRRPESDYDDEDEMEEDAVNAVVNWVTPTNSLNQAEASYISYGNEASLSSIYGDFCLLVHVGPPQKRTTTSNA